MTLWLHVNYRLTCPKHRRYDPIAQGEAGIKGGCSFCRCLLDLSRQAGRLLDEAALAEKVLKAAKA